MKPPAIIVDLDGTLCDTAHRQHHLEKKPKDWKSFFAGIPDDQPNEWCKRIVWAFEHKAQIIYVSGRDEDHRANTKQWLKSFHLEGIPKHPLFMRIAGDHRDDTIIKEELYRKYIEPNYQVMFCIDDRPKVARMWRSIGLTCLQCNDKEF